ncbi:metal ABC transporter solute-binding protein, Zn/Mn family [Atopobium fossor]|uniref:metal ABC transporter solute-binding protein, Zn/Mn family n=1 Tax=Atopobium fossor TaxID=39487 RepID=UPI000423472B|nr:zinc ABC transporter substrate-binding protein [Atopobium fossor]
MNRNMSRADFLRLSGATAFVVAPTLLGLSGCNKPATNGAADSSKLQVLASFYPMADFAKKIGGDKIEVKNLVPAGTEPHDWEPSTADMVNFSNAKLLVYNGAGMEHWVDDTLKSLGDGAPTALAASDGITLLEAAKTDPEHEHEDHDHEHEHEHEEHEHDEKTEEHEHEHEHDHDHGAYDPHVWLDPQNAKAEMKNIMDALIKLDPNNKDTYSANFAKWEVECDVLDSEFSEQLVSVSQRTVVVSHAAFGYLCNKYGLTQYSIGDIDAEAEPDAKRMAEIADYVKKNNVTTIFSEELVSPKVAQAIAQEAGAKMEELNPLEGLSDEEIAAGEDYFSVMRSNLKKLVGALS